MGEYFLGLKVYEPTERNANDGVGCSDSLRIPKLITSLCMVALLLACGGGSSPNDNGQSGSGSKYKVDPPLAKNALKPDCNGLGCGTLDSNTYSGSGLGVWKYTNESTLASKIDIDITGITAKNTVTLLVSNGTDSTQQDIPSYGERGSGTIGLDLAGPRSAVLETSLAGDSEHEVISRRNREVAEYIRSLPTSNLVNQDRSANTPVKSIASNFEIGDTKNWIDNSDIPVSYSTTLRAKCQLTSGRNVLLWREPSAENLVSDSDLLETLRTLCGPQGGLAKISDLLGDVWGREASNYHFLIQDTGSSQDINVVFLPVASVSWAGYFWSGNNVLKSTAPQFSMSNESLVFFMNAYQVSTNREFALSTLLHEATHMTSFYQRVVRGGVIPFNTWLEETIAMMTEDIVSPTVINGYNKIATQRIPRYMASGGNVSYINWPTLSADNYTVGGAFAAYLNRRYGIGLYQQLLTSCTSEPKVNDSYECLNSLIKSRGGIGFEDDFAYMGASVFANPKSYPLNIPKYGFPAVISGGYNLQKIDLSSIASLIPVNARNPGLNFKATSHTYLKDAVSGVSNKYSRKNIIVPAKTILFVVVQ